MLQNNLGHFFSRYRKVSLFSVLLSLFLREIHIRRNKEAVKRYLLLVLTDAKCVIIVASLFLQEDLFRLELMHSKQSKFGLLI